MGTKDSQCSGTVHYKADCVACLSLRPLPTYPPSNVKLNGKSRIPRPAKIYGGSRTAKALMPYLFMAVITKNVPNRTPPHAVSPETIQPRGLKYPIPKPERKKKSVATTIRIIADSPAPISEKTMLNPMIPRTIARIAKAKVLSANMKFHFTYFVRRQSNVSY